MFPLIPGPNLQPRIRSNSTYDEIIGEMENMNETEKKLNRAILKGHVGPCIFRSLRYFDVGNSFLSDSLHNIYHGVMVSITEKSFSSNFLIHVQMNR